MLIVGVVLLLGGDIAGGQRIKRILNIVELKMTLLCLDPVFWLIV